MTRRSLENSYHDKAARWILALPRTPSTGAFKKYMGRIGDAVLNNMIRVNDAQVIDDKVFVSYPAARILLDEDEFAAHSHLIAPED